MGKSKKDLENEEEQSSATTHAIAMSIQKNEKFITLRDTGLLYYFNPEDGQYHEGETFLKEIIRKKTNSTFSTYLLREVTEMVKIDSYLEPENFTCPVEWINLKNGAYNLKTGEFIRRMKKPEPDVTVERRIQELEKKRELRLKELKEKHKKDTLGMDAVDAMDVDEEFRINIRKIGNEFLLLINKERTKLNAEIQKWRQDQIDIFGKFNFTITIPVKFDPEASCPKIDAFFQEVQNGNDNVERLYELFGFCLWKDYQIKRFVIFLGDHDTGKSTTANLLTIFLGDANLSGLSMQAIIDDKFDRIKLHRRLANISGELAPHFIRDTSLIKQLTGRDPISVRLMHSQKDFKFKNFAKLIFLANEIPSTYETDGGYFSRTEIWEFSKQFTSGSTMNENILDEIVAESELSGLFNRSVKALRELLKNGKFTGSRTSEEKKQAYLIQANPFKVYIENRIGYFWDDPSCDNPEDLTIRKDQLFQDSVVWCRNNDVQAWTENMFYRRVNAYFLKNGIRSHRSSKNGSEYYSGIYFKEILNVPENHRTPPDTSENTAPENNGTYIDNL